MHARLITLLSLTLALAASAQTLKYRPYAVQVMGSTDGETYTPIYTSLAPLPNQPPVVPKVMLYCYNASTKTAAPCSTLGPQGLTGPVGPQGAVGVAGKAGPIGATGSIGPAGAQGVPGIAGATGPAGPVGVAGVKGDAGPAGATGAQGPAGPAGPQGSTGQTGATGPAGAPGSAGAAGPTGAQGSAGMPYTPLIATTPVLGGTLLAVGGCTSTFTVSMPGAVVGRHVSMDPSGGAWLAPGLQAQAVVLAAGVVSYRLCTVVALTPTATTYALQQ